MIVNKRLIAVFSLLSLVGLMAMSVPEEEKPRGTNLKVLPKNISPKQLDDLMEEWEHALGARCSLCHVRNEETKKMDWANDAKPEKEIARKMYKMTAALNKKYFGAKKDSLGMMMESGVNCNSCHKGVAHPEVVKAWSGRKGPAKPRAIPAASTPVPVGGQ